MRYFYYPGCSLAGTAREYDLSTRAVMGALGVELMEIEDWTCCGASAAEATSSLLALALPARNLALAQRVNREADFLIPCSSCYLNLRRVDEHVRGDEGLLDRVNNVLAEEGLTYTGGMRSRHLLDVLSTDLGSAKIRPLVRRTFAGLRIAPYYGCQALRPYSSFDDPQEPHSMEPLIEAVEAEVYPWALGATCCGAGLMTTTKEVALELTGALLAAARGADCIVTVCPMCQMNLDSFQGPISRAKGVGVSISVLYLPQLLGLALGLSDEAVGLGRNMMVTDSFREKLRACA